MVNLVQYVVPFVHITYEDVPAFGGKNAALGELMKHLSPNGIKIPNGYALSASAYNRFIVENELELIISGLVNKLDTKDFSNLNEISFSIQENILKGKIPADIYHQIETMYKELCSTEGRIVDVAVRSSATAEDLPTASFAGQHESYLNVTGVDSIALAIVKCYASLFGARAIKYRIDHAFKYEDVSISVGIQQMVRSDLGASGTVFTIDPDTGFDKVLIIQATYGLGENLVKGSIVPDEYTVYKKQLVQNRRSIIAKSIGSKRKTLVYRKNGVGTRNLNTSLSKRNALVLNDDQIQQLAEWAITIEKHFKHPMDIEWAIDGNSNELFILQARPETVHAQKKKLILETIKVINQGKTILTGQAVGRGVESGIVQIFNNPLDAQALEKGNILVTEKTNPDWDPVLKKASAIITDSGGRTSHAAIVAREYGTLAIVGAKSATQSLKQGSIVTVDNSKGQTGFVYEGHAKWIKNEIEIADLKLPKTPANLIVADPFQAYEYSFYPSSGVGLLRLEFMINTLIGIHPMALINYNQLKKSSTKRKILKLTGEYADKKQFFTQRLTEGIARIAAAFYPRPVIVRLSDFKSNEYGQLLGGEQFETPEENPMIGFRGASRYANVHYAEAFELECATIKNVREKLGFDNVKVMIPFCRTPEEAEKVNELLMKNGLVRGKNGLEVYMMIEIPSNVLLLDQFGKYYDGFSIGSNDLTQLTLGLDRDSPEVSDSFDEMNEAVVELILSAIQQAKKLGKKIGICGQAPSDNPDFTELLINSGIDSISFNTDAFMNGIKTMANAEKNIKQLVWND